MTQPEVPQPTASKLHRRLGGDDLGELRQRMRRHFERYGDDPQKNILHLTRLSPLEYEAIALLVGLPTRTAQSVRIEIAHFNAALVHAGMANSLRHALEMLDGPVVHRSAVRAETQARWAAAVTAASHHPTLTAWLDVVGTGGLLKRSARQDPEAAARLLSQADAVLHELPANGLTLAQLAAKALGNAHALDGGQAVATLVLAALRHQDKNAVITEAELVDDAAPDAETSKLPERVRDVWARAGVLVNELARPALFLNLPVHPSSTPLSIEGEPSYLSLRRLVRTRIEWAVENERIYVCENPNIVSIAADQLGSACPPLVCTEGMPAAAQRILLTQLADAGAELHYHGDFDWAGIQIGNYVIKLFNAQPWRFSSDDYIEALTLIPSKDYDLVGEGVSAKWDSALLAQMRTHKLAVDEEAVAPLLINDLRRGYATSSVPTGRTPKI